MSEEQPVFKVTDRRLFNPDGTPREVEPAEATETTAGEAKIENAPAGEGAGSAAPETAQGAPPAAPEQQATEQPAEEGLEGDMAGGYDPASFLGHAMFVATNAAAFLGLMPHPETGQPEVDLQVAKHWIDVLGMLKQKTQGNLDSREQQFLDGWLADLRMQYVSLTNAGPPKAPRGFTGRDIIGGK